MQIVFDCCRLTGHTDIDLLRQPTYNKPNCPSPAIFCLVAASLRHFGSRLSPGARRHVRRMTGMKEDTMQTASPSVQTAATPHYAVKEPQSSPRGSAGCATTTSPGSRASGTTSSPAGPPARPGTSSTTRPATTSSPRPTPSSSLPRLGPAGGARRRAAPRLLALEPARAPGVVHPRGHGRPRARRRCCPAT